MYFLIFWRNTYCNRISNLLFIVIIIHTRYYKLELRMACYQEKTSPKQFMSPAYYMSNRLRDAAWPKWLPKITTFSRVQTLPQMSCTIGILNFDLLHKGVIRFCKFRTTKNGEIILASNFAE